MYSKIYICVIITYKLQDNNEETQGDKPKSQPDIIADKDLKNEQGASETVSFVVISKKSRQKVLCNQSEN